MSSLIPHASHRVATTLITDTLCRVIVRRSFLILRDDSTSLIILHLVGPLCRLVTSIRYIMLGHTPCLLADHCIVIVTPRLTAALLRRRPDLLSDTTASSTRMTFVTSFTHLVIHHSHGHRTRPLSFVCSSVLTPIAWYRYFSHSHGLFPRWITIRRSHVTHHICDSYAKHFW